MDDESFRRMIAERPLELKGAKGADKALDMADPGADL